MTLPTLTASRILRNDSGPSGELGPPEKFVEIGGLYYAMAQILSVPGIQREQLVCTENWRDYPGYWNSLPKEVRERRRAKHRAETERKMAAPPASERQQKTEPPYCWILEHENTPGRTWHYFPTEHSDAACGRGRITGSPLWCNDPVHQSNFPVCGKCRDYWLEVGV